MIPSPEKSLVPLPDISGYFECAMNGCGGRLIRRTGRYGVFFGCSNYPECKFTRRAESVEDEYTHKVIGEFDADEPVY